jgi:predicted secreted protein
MCYGNSTFSLRRIDQILITRTIGNWMARLSPAKPPSAAMDAQARFFFAPHFSENRYTKLISISSCVVNMQLIRDFGPMAGAAVLVSISHSGTHAGVIPSMRQYGMNMPS